MLFNLTGPSSVYNSINDSGYTKSTMLSIFDNITNSLIESNKYIPFYQASSSEMFGVQKNPKHSKQLEGYQESLEHGACGG